jgi:hypothetical protein
VGGAVEAARPLSFRGLAAWLCLALVSAPWRAAAAAGALGARGAPIQTSDYAIDLFEGPVLSSSRVTAMAGAYSAIAEDVEGMTANAAAPAVRDPFSFSDFDYDVSLGFTSASTLGNTDFDNNGTVGFRYRDFLFATIGGIVQYGAWGVGVQIDAQDYGLDHAVSAVDSRTLGVSLARSHVQLARRFYQGQLVVGAGLRGATLTLSASGDAESGGGGGEGDGSTELLKISGAGLEAGALWAPLGAPIRVALTGRTAVGDSPDVKGEVSPTPEGDVLVGGLYLPTSVRLPWEIEAGFAVELGRRPLNVPWVNPSDVTEEELAAERRERSLEEAAQAQGAGAGGEEGLGAQRKRLLRRRYEALPRHRVLLSASLLVSGPVGRAVGVESFLSQTVERAGRRAVVMPRLGAELEPVEGWLKVRAGTYLEPSRFEQGRVRPHVTGGLEVKVLPWTVFGLFDQATWWRVSGFLDAARQYSSFGVSVGIWHLGQRSRQRDRDRGHQQRHTDEPRRGERRGHDRRRRRREEPPLPAERDQDAISPGQQDVLVADPAAVVVGRDGLALLGEARHQHRVAVADEALDELDLGSAGVDHVGEGREPRQERAPGQLDGSGTPHDLDLRRRDAALSGAVRDARVPGDELPPADRPVVGRGLAPAGRPAAVDVDVERDARRAEGRAQGLAGGDAPGDLGGPGGDVGDRRGRSGDDLTDGRECVGAARLQRTDRAPEEQRDDRRVERVADHVSPSGPRATRSRTSCSSSMLSTACRHATRSSPPAPSQPIALRRSAEAGGSAGGASAWSSPSPQRTSRSPCLQAITSMASPSRRQASDHLLLPGALQVAGVGLPPA